MRVAAATPHRRPMSLVNQRPHSLLAYCPSDTQERDRADVLARRSSNRLEAPAKRVTVFLHFSGSGGTSLVYYVRKLKQGFSLPPMDISRNANYGCAAEQHCHNASYAASRRCPCADVNKAVAHGYTWWANENPVLAPLHCPRVSYWTVIRHPVDRILSRMFKPANQKVQPGKAVRFITLEQAKAALEQETYFPAQDVHGRHYAEFASSFGLSNWITRSLGGPSVFSLPLGGINDSHLQAALQTLSGFDVVVPLPSLSKLPSVLSLLWGQCIAKRVPAYVSRAHSGSTNESAVMLAAAKADVPFMSALRAANAVDARLFSAVSKQFARQYSGVANDPRWPCERGQQQQQQQEGQGGSSQVSPIPRTIHVIWPNKELAFSDRPREEAKQRAWHAQLRSLNPDWKVQVWTDADCLRLVRESFSHFLNTWKALTPKLKMWDAVRPLILFIHGGLYIDVDVECTKPLAPLIEGATLLLRYNFHSEKYPGPALGNHIMGSAPHHPLWLEYIAGIERDHYADPTAKVVLHTGNGQLTKAITALRTNNPDAWNGTRLLTENEFTNNQGCEDLGLHSCKKTIFCRHMQELSPAEAAGEDDDHSRQTRRSQKRARKDVKKDRKKDK